MSARRALAPLLALLTLLVPLALGAQQSGGRGHRWRALALGAATSIGLHEAAHVAASLSMGARPHFGLDRGRPTIFSGIVAEEEPHKMLVFSSAGLGAQMLVDELVLDVPHGRGGAFERGVLVGGVGTALFYITLGRNGSVSDVAYIASTSGLEKSRVSLIIGGVTAVHAWRAARGGFLRGLYAAPDASGRLRVGIVR